MLLVWLWGILNREVGDNSVIIEKYKYVIQNMKNVRQTYKR